MAVTNPEVYINLFRLKPDELKSLHGRLSSEPKYVFAYIACTLLLRLVGKSISPTLETNLQHMEFKTMRVPDRIAEELNLRPVDPAQEIKLVLEKHPTQYSDGTLGQSLFSERTARV